MAVKMVARTLHFWILRNSYLYERNEKFKKYQGIKDWVIIDVVSLWRTVNYIQHIASKSGLYSVFALVNQNS